MDKKTMNTINYSKKNSRTLKFSFKYILTFLFFIILSSNNIWGQQTITWTGATDTNWSTNTNWDKNTVPTLVDTVIINSSSNNPIISSTSGVTIGNLTINNGATLTIGESSILGSDPTSKLIVSTDFTNNGTLTINKNSSATVNNITNLGTIKNTNGTLICKGNFTDSGTYTKKKSSILQIDGTVDQTLDLIQKNYGKVEITKNASGKKTFKNKLIAESLTTSQNTELCFNNGFSITDSVIFNGIVYLGGKAETTTTTATQTYNKEVFILSDSVLTADGNITFDPTTTIKNTSTPNLSTLQINSTNGDVILASIGETAATSNSNFTSIVINAKKNITLPPSIATSGAQKYEGIVTTYSKGTKLTSLTDGDITFNKAVNGKKLEVDIPDDKTLTFNDTVTLESFVDSAKKININFTKGGTISSDTSFNTTGNIIFGDKSSTKMAFYDSIVSPTTYYALTTKGPTTITENTHLIAKTVNIGNNITIPTNATLEVKENFTNKGVLTNNGTLNLGGNFQNDTGSSYTGNNDTIEFSGSGSQTFTDSNPITIGTIVISNKTGPITLDAQLTTNNLSLTCPINFNKDVTINEYLRIKENTNATITIQNKALCSVNNFINEKKAKLNLELDKTLSVNENFTNEPDASVNLNGILSVKKNFINNGAFTNNGTLNLSGNFQNDAGSSYTGNNDTIEFSGSGTQTFTDTTNPITISTIVINNKTGPITFDTQLQITSISDTNDTSNNAVINFNKDTKVTNTANFYTKKTITLGSNIKPIPTITFENDFNHIAGPTVIQSTLNAKKIELGNTTLTSQASITATSVTLGSNGTPTEPIYLAGNITASTQNYKGPVNLTGETFLKADTSTPKNITFGSTIEGKQNLIIGDNTQIIDTIVFKEAINNLSKLSTIANSITLPSTVNAVTQLYDTKDSLIINNNTDLKGENITLFDNINGNNYVLNIYTFKKLYIKDTTLDPTDTSSNMTNLKDFLIYETKGNIYMSGDIETIDSISFSSPITLEGNVSLISKNISFGTNSSINEQYELIINSTESTSLGANIGDTKPLKKLDITTDNATLPQIVSADTIILAKDTKNYPALSLHSNGTSLKGNNITLSDNIKSSASTLLVELINSNALLKFLDKTTVNDINDTANLKSFTQIGEGTVSISGDINATDNIKFNSSLNLLDNVYLNANNVSLANTLNKINEINGAYNLKIGTTSSPTVDNVTINANLGQTTPLSLLEINALNINFKLDTTNIKTTDNQTYNGNVSFKDASLSTDTASKSIDIMFTKSVSADNLTLNVPEGNVTFTDTLTIAKNTLKDKTFNAYNLNINNGGSTKEALSLLTTGIVNINDAEGEIFTIGEATTTPKYKNFTHTKGLTNIKGTLNANDITLTKTNIEGTINANNIKSGETTFSGSIFANTVLFGENKENISLAGNIKTKNKQTYNGNTTLTKETTLEIPSITPPVDPYPYITFTENSSLDIKGNKLILKAHSLYKGNNITSNTGSNTGSIIANDHDFIIQSENKNVALSSDITSNYFILDVSKLGNNTFTLNNNITTNKDIVIYGSSFCTTDQESGNTDIYVYDTYTSPVKPILPVSRKQSNPPTSFAETIYIGKNIKLQSTGNLYINGAKIATAPSIELTLEFPNNYNTISTYAQSFYSDFSTANCNILNPNKSKLVTEACKLDDTKQNYNTGWDSKPFIITKAYTVDDNVICIEFDREIRQISDDKKNGLSQKNGNRISYTANSSNRAYEKAIFKENGSSFNPLPVTSNRSGDDSLKKIFLVSSDTWNTDATGTEIGNGTDKDGNHKTNILPTIDIKRNSNNGELYNYFITDMYGKRLTHYSDNTSTGTKKYTENKKPSPSEDAPSYDQCAPVILSVSTGQEFHDTDPTKWTSYDSHNFIEFCYSEDVTVGDAIELNPDIMSYDTLAPVNIDPTAIIGNITNHNDGFTIAGLGTIEQGAIRTGTKDNENDLSINTLYRKNPHSIRISIAGKTIDDANGEKQWVGFINDRTYLPKGILITPEKNSAVKDLSKNILKSLDNIKLSTETSLDRLPVTIPVSNIEAPRIGSNNTSDNTYGEWDLSKPVFAPLNISDADNAIWEPNPENQYEIVGYTSRGTKLTELEFHMLDNTPDLTSNALVWYSSKGWYQNNKQITSCADIYGGSRQTAIAANGDFIPSKTTTGGIRFHTVNSDAFSYEVNNTKKRFVRTMPLADSGFYLGYSTSTVFTQNHTGELYFKLELEDKQHTVDTNFKIAYEPNKNTGYITDLAGNRLNAVSSKNPISSIDRIPPNLNISLSPMNQKEIFIVLSKKLQTDINEIVFRDANKNVIDLQVTSSFEEALPYNFKIIKIDETGAVLPYTEDTPKIDTSVKAEVNEIKKKDGKILTSIKLTLDRNVTYEDLRTCYLQIIAPTDKNGNLIKTSYDMITGIKDAQVSFLRDRIGNFMPMYTATPISKFAINFVNPLYAHNPEIKNNNKSFMDGLYKDGSWAVHDWSRNQQNYGTVYANEAVEIVAQVNNGQKDKTNLPQGIVMYIDDSPDKESISKQVNNDLNKDYRIWLPKVNPDYIIPSLSFVNNKDYKTLLATYPSYVREEIRYYDYSRAFFNLDKELAKMYGPNKQLSFLFALSDTPITNITSFTPVKIYEKLFIDSEDKYDLSKSIQIPLYCLRLEDNTDITSIDMWSYKTRDISKQRGGVTILNNVINASNGEETVLQVSVPEDGNLNVMVLTLDGNIVKYLHRGQIKSGEYNFYWNGTNENKSEVARGMYFIRVVGTSFDETRKVMVVK